MSAGLRTGRPRGSGPLALRRPLCRPDRDTIAATLCEAGLRVLVADARGHGASGPLAQEGGRWGYDELESFPNKVEIFTASVDGDLRDPAYIMKCARTPTPTHTPAAPLWRSGSLFSFILALLSS